MRHSQSLLRPRQRFNQAIVLSAQANAPCERQHRLAGIPATKVRPRRIELEFPGAPMTGNRAFWFLIRLSAAKRPTLM